MTQLVTASGMPVHPIGIGTWGISSRENKQTYDALANIGYKNVEPYLGNEKAEIEGLKYSLLAGQNYIDTAGLYGAGYTNEVVGMAIAGVLDKVPRERMFVAHNVWKSDYGRVKPMVELALEKLGIEYFDVAGPHSPHTTDWDTPPWQSAMRDISELIDEGLVLGASVSNFSAIDIEEAEQIIGNQVITAQMGFSVLDRKDQLLDNCKDRHIQVVGYQALRGRVLQNPVVTDIAESHGVSSAEVGLAYVIHRGVLPITKSTDPRHIDTNLKATHLALTNEEMNRLSRTT